MKCTQCDSTKFDKGVITNNGQHWLNEDSAGGKLNKMIGKGFGMFTVSAYKCQKYGTILLSSQDQSK